MLVCAAVCAALQVVAEYEQAMGMHEHMLQIKQERERALMQKRRKRKLRKKKEKAAAAAHALSSIEEASAMCVQRFVVPRWVILPIVPYCAQKHQL